MIKLKPLLSELTQHQKELKKDYLFRQTKMRSSSTIPPFDEVWEVLQHSDGFKHELEWLIHQEPLKPYEVDKDEITTRLIDSMKDHQYDRYREIVDTYENMEGEFCWRKIIVPRTVNPVTLPQLGIYWAVADNAADAHWGKHFSSPHFSCTYEALIELKNVDWPGTIYSRMDLSLGDNEMEIRFLKNSTLLVRKVKVHDNVKDTTIDYFINNRRRA